MSTDVDELLRFQFAWIIDARRISEVLWGATEQNDQTGARFRPQSRPPSLHRHADHKIDLSFSPFRVLPARRRREWPQELSHCTSFATTDVAVQEMRGLFRTAANQIRFARKSNYDGHRLVVLLLARPPRGLATLEHPMSCGEISRQQTWKLSISKKHFVVWEQLRLRRFSWWYASS